MAVKNYPLAAIGGRVDMKTISRDELKQKIDRKDNFSLVETLAKVTYDHEHLPGAINLPPDQVSALAPRLFPDKNAEIVVYCASPS
jgi:rhodanese-related sulfurtransferase